MDELSKQFYNLIISGDYDGNELRSAIKLMTDSASPTISDEDRSTLFNLAKDKLSSLGIELPETIDESNALDVSKSFFNTVEQIKREAGGKEEIEKYRETKGLSQEFYTSRKEANDKYRLSTSEQDNRKFIYGWGIGLKDHNFHNDAFLNNRDDDHSQRQSLETYYSEFSQIEKDSEQLIGKEPDYNKKAELQQKIDELQAKVASDLEQINSQIQRQEERSKRFSDRADYLNAYLRSNREVKKLENRLEQRQKDVLDAKNSSEEDFNLDSPSSRSSNPRNYAATTDLEGIEKDEHLIDISKTLKLLMEIEGEIISGNKPGAPGSQTDYFISEFLAEYKKSDNKGKEGLSEALDSDIKTLSKTDDVQGLSSENSELLNNYQEIKWWKQVENLLGAEAHFGEVTEFNVEYNENLSEDSNSKKNLITTIKELANIHEYRAKILDKSVQDLEAKKRTLTQMQNDLEQMEKSLANDNYAEISVISGDVSSSLEAQKNIWDKNIKADEDGLNRKNEAKKIKEESIKEMNEDGKKDKERIKVNNKENEDAKKAIIKLEDENIISKSEDAPGKQNEEVLGEPSVQNLFNEKEEEKLSAEREEERQRNKDKAYEKKALRLEEKRASKLKLSVSADYGVSFVNTKGGFDNSIILQDRDEFILSESYNNGEYNIDKIQLKKSGVNLNAIHWHLNTNGHFEIEYSLGYEQSSNSEEVVQRDYSVNFSSARYIQGGVLSQKNAEPSASLGFYSNFTYSSFPGEKAATSVIPLPENLHGAAKNLKSNSFLNIGGSFEIERPLNNSSRLHLSGSAGIGLITSQNSTKSESGFGGSTSAIYEEPSLSVPGYFGQSISVIQYTPVTDLGNGNYRIKDFSNTTSWPSELPRDPYLNTTIINASASPVFDPSGPFHAQDLLQQSTEISSVGGTYRINSFRGDNSQGFTFRPEIQANFKTGISNFKIGKVTTDLYLTMDIKTQRIDGQESFKLTNTSHDYTLIDFNNGSHDVNRMPRIYSEESLTPLSGVEYSDVNNIKLRQTSVTPRLELNIRF